MLLNARLSSGVAAALLSVAFVPAAQAQQAVNVLLPAPQHEVVLDPERAVLYASLPTRNTIAVVSMQSWTLLKELPVPANPRGLDLSLDGTRLYTAHFNTGQISVLDLATELYTTINVAAQLADQRTWDVLEVQPGRLLVTGNPNSNGFAYVVQVLLNQGAAQSRVASGRIIRGGPNLEMAPGANHVYISEPSFSPDSVYRLDLTQPTAPIVAEDDHGLVSGSLYMAVQPNDERVYLGSGQALASATLDQVALIPGGGVAAFASDDPFRVWYARLNGTTIQLKAYAVATDALLETINLAGPVPTTLSDALILPQGLGYVVVGDNRIVGLVQPAPCAGVVSQACSGALNSRGLSGTLTLDGSTSISANGMSLRLSNLPTRAVHQVIYGQGSVQLAFGDGYLCISPYTAPLRRLGAPAVADENGLATRTLNFAAQPLLSSPITSFSTWRFQAMYRDPAAIASGGSGFNMTSAVEISFCP